MNTTAIDNTIVYHQTPDVICRAILDETILVPISGNLANMQNIFSLDAVGAFIWENLNGTKTLSDIHQLVIDEFDVESNRARTDLHDFIDELTRAGLLTADR